ncbi:hypothetical protein BC827DRAFT_841994 [Russula dissimulans]|nr:hypothetical protein BC827DRAFT_841994 [Russula dissimulans]
MASLFRSFRPLATQCATSAILFASGDIIAQQLIERKSVEHDFARMARLTFYGASKWISFLNRLEFATPAKAAIYRTWLDQTLMAPFAVFLFFTSMPLLEGKGVSDIVENMNTACPLFRSPPSHVFLTPLQMYAPTLMRGWAVYTPTQIVNFTLVPPQFRFVFVSVVSVAWNTYLSIINAQLSKDTEDL